MEENKQPTTPDKKDIEDNKAVAAIAYLSILCFVPMLTQKESKFAQFHAKQGLAIFIVEVVASIIWIIPILGWFIGFIAYAACTIASLYGIINAINGKQIEIPGFSNLAKKLNL